jgi:hypothetical protein
MSLRAAAKQSRVTREISDATMDYFAWLIRPASGSANAAL